MRSIVSEALRSASLGIIDAGKYVKSDRTGLVLYSGGIVTDGAVMCQTRDNSCCRVGIMLDRRREGVSDDKGDVGDMADIRMELATSQEWEGPNGYSSV